MDTEQVVEHAAVEGRDPRWRRRVNLWIAGLAVSIVALAVWGAWQWASARQLAADQSHAATVAEQLAGQVVALGAKPVAAPPTPVTGAPGAAGATGAAGRGITATAIVNGDLVIHYSDGTTANVGAVVGANGRDGRSVIATAIVGNNLNVSYSDGTTTDVGPVVGPQGAVGTAGRGVQSAAIDAATGHLMITYTDGSTVDAGQAVGPAGQNGTDGKDGATGPAGPQGVSITDLTFQRDSSGTCQAVVTLHDPATGTDNTVTHPAGDAACPLVATNLLHPGK